MFGEIVPIIAIAALVMFFTGGLAYAFLFQTVQTEDMTSKRISAISNRAEVAAEAKANADQTTRRRDIQSAIKDFEARQQAKLKQSASPPLQVRLQQAGLKWNKRSYYTFSVICALFGFGIGLVVGGNMLLAGGAALIGGLGFPRWFIASRRKRRLKKFLDELPNAVDVIVRGIRSGLPLSDCLRIISTEAREPVRSEFRLIVESQQVGMTVSDACLKLFDRVPAAEANFFGIVIGIQQKAGGNLSEALGNLSRVLRDRKKMRQKINAMSMEAKASAGIIGSLPIIVTGLVYLTSPNYISLLFTTKTGNIIVAGSLLYMLIGVLVMKKMINFDI
jgi:tight adherence protein B